MADVEFDDDAHTTSRRVIDLRSPGVVLNVEGQSFEMPPGTSLSIGRSDDCDVTLAAKGISRHHARVDSVGDGLVVVTDLGSANGTRLLGTPRETETVEAREPRRLSLAPGSGLTIQIGDPQDETMSARLMLRGPDTVGGQPHPGFTRNRDDEDRRITMIPASPTLTIGRDADNDIRLDDYTVSRHHARCESTPDGFVVEDLGSTNGTYVNGRATNGPTLLREHDQLSVGRSLFTVTHGQLRHTVERVATLRASKLSVALRDGHRILDDVDFSLPGGHLMAVIGPSGAGKSTLVRALSGAAKATSGTVTYAGRDLYASFDQIKHRIGLVPQDDIVHRRLTVIQALFFAADLRFAADLLHHERKQRVNEVMDRLDLVAHADTRVDKLSGGQRKRVSVAMELLTEPSLLILDEPTSGLDPGLDKTVMELLYYLAHPQDDDQEPRTVVVVTHSVANLHVCDQVLMLAPGGKVAFDGPPEALLAYFGSDSYAEVFEQVSLDPTGAQQEFASTRRDDVSADPPVPVAAPVGNRHRHSRAGQLVTLATRQLRLASSDVFYALATLALPLLIALMVLAIPGDNGFWLATSTPSAEPSQLLVVMMVGAAFMGAVATIRELIGERAIFLRERAVGVSTGAYVAAKVGLALVVTFIQSMILVSIVLMMRSGPRYGVLFGSSSVWGELELLVAVWMTAFVTAVAALLVSAVVTSGEQVMPALVVMIMGQLVLCGGLITVTDRFPLSQLSWFSPSRWGYAAAASTVDLTRLNPAAPADSLWRHESGAWLTSMSVLASMAVIGVALTYWRLSRTTEN